jgi:hypothetical protein
MTTTVLGIYNAALSAVRAKGRLSSITDESREREECDFWYPLVRNRVQEAAFWPGSRRTARLALLQERDFTVAWADGDPETQFKYSYALPSDYLRAWHLINYEQFSISFDATRTRNVLSTNASPALLIYGAVQENPVFWSPGQQQATIYALAAAIAGPISGQNSLQDINYNLADQMIMAARADTQMGVSLQVETLPPALAIRGYTDYKETRYYYPYGMLFGEARA